jgi:hypothetical protein
MEAYRIARRREHFLDNRITGGGEDVCLARRPRFIPEEDLWY